MGHGCPFCRRAHARPPQFCFYRKGIPVGSNWFKNRLRNREIVGPSKRMVDAHVVASFSDDVRLRLAPYWPAETM
jgi:hypothetical protein